MSRVMGRSAALAAAIPSDREADDQRHALGFALGLRAGEGARRVEVQMRSASWRGRVASVAYRRRAFEAIQFSILLNARWLVTGAVADADETAFISSRGEMAAAEQISIVNATRQNLMWRDTTIAILREEAERLGTAPEILADAVEMVRNGCDSAQMRLAAAFDVRLQDLSTALEAEHETLRHHALHDQLTGLANRMLLEDRLAHTTLMASRHAAGFALLLIDLDGFKTVNDTFGHDTGDAVLRQVARRLLTTVRASDTVARLGGDEFVVILPGADRNGAEIMCARIQESLGRAIEIDDPAVAVGASIGVAIYPDDATEPRSILRAADGAMYRAKRNQVFKIEFAHPKPAPRRALIQLATAGGGQVQNSDS
jgi:diguanylate cyclase (GGDEF)-like protein